MDQNQVRETYETPVVIDLGTPPNSPSSPAPSANTGDADHAGTASRPSGSRVFPRAISHDAPYLFHLRPRHPQ